MSRSWKQPFKNHKLIHVAAILSLYDPHYKIGEFQAYFDLLCINLIEILPEKCLHWHLHTQRDARTHAHIKKTILG